MPYVHIEAADVLREVADADLVAEVVDRRLQERVIAAGSRHEHPEQAHADLAREALQDLLGLRTRMARAVMLRLIAMFLPPGVQRREIIWSRNKDGVWHPRRKTAADKRREEIRRRWRSAKYWLRHGWHSDLRWKVLFPAQVRVMRALGYAWIYERYDHETKKSIYRWQRQPRKLPPWEREAMRGRDEA